MKFAVVGLGLFGKKLALELARMDHQVLAIDRDEEPVSVVQNEVNKAVIGDASKDDLLSELITPDFDALIVTLASNLEASLLTVLHAKEIGVDRIIAKSNGPEHTTILRRLGIDEIIMPEEDVATQLAETVGNPNVLDFLQLQDGYGMMECNVPDSFVGRSLRDMNLREEHGIQVIGVQTGGTGEVDFVPSPNVPFEADDVLWMAGPDDALAEFSD
jgi:trk system potassium uptake protein TrkA